MAAAAAAREEEEKLDTKFKRGFMNAGSVRFSQDYSCFLYGSGRGFGVYDTDPLQVRRKHDGFVFDVVLLDVMFESNVFLIVGNSPPDAHPNEVWIWDDVNCRFTARLDMPGTVRGLRVRRDAIVVVLMNSVYVFSVPNLAQLHTLQSRQNWHGVCSITSAKADAMVLAFPGPSMLEVHHLWPVRKTTTIVGNARCIELNVDGSLVAAASQSNLIISVYSTTQGTLLHRFQRGLNSSPMFSIAFSPSSRYLAVCSERTVHVFNLEAPERVSLLSSVVALLSWRWSFAQFRLPIPEGAVARSVVAFNKEDENSLLVVSWHGPLHGVGKNTLLKGSFDPVRGGSFYHTEKRVLEPGCFRSWPN